MTQVVTHKDWAKVLRARLKDDVEVARLATVDVAYVGLAKAEARTDDLNFEYTGAYRTSWEVQRTKTGAKLVNLAPYAKVIEWGRRPGAKAPPPEVIQEWVRKKLVPLGKLEGITDENVGDHEATIKSVAFLIGRAIKRRGIPAKLVLATADLDMRLVFRATLRKRLRKRTTTGAGR